MKNFSQQELTYIKDNDLDIDIIKEANFNGIYKSSENFLYWSKIESFYQISLNMNSNFNNVTIEELGTNTLLKSMTFENKQNALEYYVNIIINKKSFLTISLFFKIVLFYLTDILIKVFSIPFSLLFDFKDTISILKEDGFKEVFENVFFQSWLRFDSFNKFKIYKITLFFILIIILIFIYFHKLYYYYKLC